MLQSLEPCRMLSRTIAQRLGSRAQERRRPCKRIRQPRPWAKKTHPARPQPWQRERGRGRRCSRRPRRWRSASERLRQPSKARCRGKPEPNSWRRLLTPRRHARLPSRCARPSSSASACNRLPSARRPRHKRRRNAMLRLPIRWQRQQSHQGEARRSSRKTWPRPRRVPG